MILDKGKDVAAVAVFGLSENGVGVSGQPIVSVVSLTDHSVVFSGAMGVLSDSAYYTEWSSQPKGTFVAIYNAKLNDGSVVSLRELFEYRQRQESEKIIAHLEGLSRIMSSIKENDETRIPHMITELYDIRLGLENFQRGVVKILPTVVLEKGIRK